MQHPEIQNLNKLSGRLNIELSEPTVSIAPPLQNQKAPPTATLVSLEFEVDVFEGDDFRPVTEEELAAVGLRAPTIRLRAESDDVVEHRAPNGAYFTVRDLVAAIAETERETRGRSTWFDGIDTSHIYFEGISPDEDGVWMIYWGS